MTLELSKEFIIDNYDLVFDPGDKLNGSLYLCRALTDPTPLDCEAMISAMRDAGFWSREDSKLVGLEQRQAYKDQLELAEAIRYKDNDGGRMFLIARFNHPKYPSDPGRWADWQKFMDEHYSRNGNS